MSQKPVIQSVKAVGLPYSRAQTVMGDMTKVTNYETHPHCNCMESCLPQKKGGPNYPFILDKKGQMCICVCQRSKEFVFPVNQMGVLASTNCISFVFLFSGFPINQYNSSYTEVKQLLGYLIGCHSSHLLDRKQTFLEWPKLIFQYKIKRT